MVNGRLPNGGSTAPAADKTSTICVHQARRFGAHRRMPEDRSIAASFS